MNKNIATYFSLAIIVLFIVYIAYDLSKDRPVAETTIIADPAEVYEAKWSVIERLEIPFGHLKSVGLGENVIVVGGENFLAAYDKKDLSLLWNITTEKEIKALSVFDDIVYASTGELINLYTL